MQTLDFVKIGEQIKGNTITLYPVWRNKKSKDLMIRGGAFLAVWDEEKKLWSTSIYDAMGIVTKMLYAAKEKKTKDFPDNAVLVDLPEDDRNGAFRKFIQYCKNQQDNFRDLNSKIIFADQETVREDYATFKLGYSMADGSMDAYNELMHTLYSPDELAKIEWAIGSLIAGEASYSQKALILHGGKGTGKSTTLDLIRALFSNKDDHYYCEFNARNLVTGRDQFATSAFKDNNPIAINDEGDLSRIFDSTTFKMIISHSPLPINEKNKSRYTITPHSFCLLATNDPIKFPRLDDGLVRRLLIVEQTGNLIRPASRFRKLDRQMLKYELGAIAKHCYDYYMSLGESRADAYIDWAPEDMLDQTDDMYAFIVENYEDMKDADGGVSADVAWNRWKEYCQKTYIDPMNRTVFRQRFGEYFKEVKYRPAIDKDGKRHRPRTYFIDLKSGLFSGKIVDGSMKKNVASSEDKEGAVDWLIMNHEPSLFDIYAADWPAQYSTKDGIPGVAWDKCKTTLADLDTSREHYVLCPENFIVLDLDKKNESGEKDSKLNLIEATKYPKTYCEFSRGGAGIHLHYIYNGDAKQLASLIDTNVEIKHCGKRGGPWALRRKLSKCNNISISTLTSGLPLKKETKNVIDEQVIKDERHLKNLILKALRKEISPGATVTSIDFIDKILNEAYDQGIKYDVTPMRNDILAFAGKSTHHARECLLKVKNMKFKSEEPAPQVEYKVGRDELVFFDVEVFPNLFVVVYKTKDSNCVKMINPSPEAIERLCTYKLVGFNNRKYDNHILYARMLGYSNAQLYSLSHRIVNSKSKDTKENGLFGNAYNLSYTDIYDFASNQNKKSLKKLEIEMGIHHQELGLPWDEPVDESLWGKVADYCCNDVIATEAAFNYLHDDFLAREMLAAITGKTVNDTTNQLTRALIFGDDKNPNSEFFYTDLSTGHVYWPGAIPGPREKYDDPRQASIDIFKRGNYDPEHLIEQTGSNNCFPGYIFQDGVSYYMGEEVGEGGYVYAEPGMYGYATTKDVASMHPHSLIALDLFGSKYTKIFADLVDARMDVKHKEYEKAGLIFEGKLKPYLTSDKDAKGVAAALKTAINSVYGLTSATYPNPFKDERNVDNIVAKRGALFMITLKHCVQAKGYTVIHTKTDSIKVKNPDKEILDFIINFGKKYGYDFETEAEWDRLCLVNNAVFIGHHTDNSPALHDRDVVNGWQAVGAEFQEPYTFKTLFTHEPIDISDLAQTKSVTSALYLDFNEGLPNVSEEETVRDLRASKATKMTNAKRKLLESYAGVSDEELAKMIAKGHSYKFIGRVGLFCPVKDGTGGGVLVRDQNGKKQAVSGTKGYRWREEEDIKLLKKQDDIDISYFESAADDAKADIEKYGDFERFVDTETPYIDITSDELPF